MFVIFSFVLCSWTGFVYLNPQIQNVVSDDLELLSLLPLPREFCDYKHAWMYVVLGFKPRISHILGRTLKACTSFKTPVLMTSGSHCHHNPGLFHREVYRHTSIPKHACSSVCTDGTGCVYYPGPGTF